MSSRNMPKWADVLLVPLFSLVIAFAISALVILAIGEDPIRAMELMVTGSLGSTYGWGYTLYYTTNFLLTGLAVSIAFQAKLFNIGGEGQALIGGLGVALVCLYVPWPNWWTAMIGAILASAVFGALWAAIPAYLQARRGSHIVITTIMFNFIAASVLNYMLSHVLRPPASMDPATARFASELRLPRLADVLEPFGIAFSRSGPANVMLFVALAFCVLAYVMMSRTKLGFEIRAFGQSEPAAHYAGISAFRIIMIAMLISGALSGVMAVNSVMGGPQRLVMNAVEGAGFIGIAVALMGRSHPIGIIAPALLFGFLFQGGSELAIETTIPREMIVIIQALVIMFTGALDNLVRQPLEAMFALGRRKS
ncbi:ABC transporter permease [Pararhodobacter zhoushanensis]|uniref:ABC transporter permease n=1 Tax=Pararhodobacter zhoushanensis TaxID=2479545 RepID=A0ABT3GW90_9RHOB|nr:ABC transporter permease [Pararhodobacter zhoushanensis]MCW1931783.1 ABC transporter permease [Pararhodobacter zhoushanensis]